MIKLSPRLQAILNNALPNCDFWDVACDHGLVGRAAYQSGLYTRVHFVDPLAHRIDTLKKDFPLAAFFNVKIENINTLITGNFTMAGVGATTIVNALKLLHQKGYLQAHRLILGPHKNEDQIADLQLGNYQLLEQVQILERGRIRSLYVFNSIEFFTCNASKP